MSIKPRFIEKFFIHYVIFCNIGKMTIKCAATILWFVPKFSMMYKYDTTTATNSRVVVVVVVVVQVVQVWYYEVFWLA